MTEDASNVEAWEALRQPPQQPLMAAVEQAADPRDPTVIQRLRKRWDAELVRCAIELALGRSKLANKTDNPGTLMSDATGAEQASGLPIARHKANRFKQVGAERVADLCCGIGLDAIALGEHMAVEAIDRDPTRVWMADHNLRASGVKNASARVADVETLDFATAGWDAVHIDPDRRGTPGRSRVWKYAEYEPGPPLIERLVHDVPGAAIKLSPGIAPEELPDGHLEIISQGRDLVQAVLWTGSLSGTGQHDRTATRVDTDRVVSLTARPNPFIPTTDADAAWLLAIHPAIERAGLIGALCEETGLGAIHPELGLLAANEPADGPWLTPYQHLATMPWRQDKVRRWLRDHDGRIAVVKTRDKTVNPDKTAALLKGDGATDHTVFILRHGQRVLAHITRGPGQ